MFFFCLGRVKCLATARYCIFAEGGGGGGGLRHILIWLEKKIPQNYGVGVLSSSTGLNSEFFDKKRKEKSKIMGGGGREGIPCPPPWSSACNRLNKKFIGITSHHSIACLISFFERSVFPMLCIYSAECVVVMNARAIFVINILFFNKALPTVGNDLDEAKLILHWLQSIGQLQIFS